MNDTPVKIQQIRAFTERPDVGWEIPETFTDTFAGKRDCSVKHYDDNPAVAYETRAGSSGVHLGCARSEIIGVEIGARRRKQARFCGAEVRSQECARVGSVRRKVRESNAIVDTSCTYFVALAASVVSRISTCAISNGAMPL